MFREISNIEGTYNLANLSSSQDLEFARVVLDNVGDVSIDEFIGIISFHAGYSLHQSRHTIAFVNSLDCIEGDLKSAAILSNLKVGDLVLSIDGDLMIKVS